MSKAWMPLYIGDYLGDTGHLSQGQHGAYLLLLMHCWQRGSLPLDKESIYRLGRASSLGERKIVDFILTEFFQLIDGGHTQKRVTKELERTNTLMSQRSEAGRSGGRKKWGVDGPTEVRSKRLANARRLARHSIEEWTNLKDVCRNCCVKCGLSGTLVKDHIVPIYQGGSDGIENLQPLCNSCNSSKGPDSTDYRPNDWKERLAKCLVNASRSCDSDCDYVRDVDSQENVDLEAKVRKIAALHPKVKDVFHLDPAVANEVAAAVARDDYPLVWAGTKALSEAVAEWPKEEKRFVMDPVKFYRTSGYLTDPEEWKWRNGNGNGTKRQNSAVEQRVKGNREVLSEALRDHIAQRVGPNSDELKDGDGASLKRRVSAGAV